MINRRKIDDYTDTIAVSFGNQVRRRRIELGLNMGQLADQASITRRWLRSIENGQRIPSIYIIASLSMALNFFEWEFFALKRL